MRAGRGVLLVVALFLVSCGGSTSVTQTGTTRYPPLPATQAVLVYSSPDEIKTPYETLGLISHTDPGKYQVLTLDDAMPALKEKARAIGANAIIVDQFSPVKSGIISTGISIRAGAIRVP